MEIRLETDLTAFEKEVRRFARQFTHPRVRNVEVSERRNMQGELIEPERASIYLVPIQPSEGCHYAITFHYKLDEWKVASVHGPSLWAARSSGQHILLKPYLLPLRYRFDFDVQFIDGFIRRCCEIWRFDFIGAVSQNTQHVAEILNENFSLAELEEMINYYKTYQNPKAQLNSWLMRSTAAPKVRARSESLNTDAPS